jgi:hypothetical protein
LQIFEKLHICFEKLHICFEKLQIFEKLHIWLEISENLVGDLREVLRSYVLSCTCTRSYRLS